jgi:NAD(P)H-hydrate epimerase
MKLVTAEQMRAVDKAAIEGRGIPSEELMENAGHGIAEHILLFLAGAEETPHFSIFCGKGNNGGDGYVVGRHLAQAGCDVTFYFLGPIDKLSKDARLNFDRVAGMGLELVEVKSELDLPEYLQTDFVVDAIFGTGFSGAPRGLAGKMIEYINDRPCPVISVDMPSGLNADNGQHEGEVVRATYTFTLALPKYGLYVSPGREMAGEASVVPIGIPPEVVQEFDFKVDLTGLIDLTWLLPDRPAEGHKGTFGKVLLVAGSLGLTGAAAMAAKSALRAGCGLAKIATPRSVLPIIAPMCQEATGHPLPEVSKKGALATRALGEIRELAESHDSLAIGPGIGQHHETAELIRRLVAKLDKPAVIDADGLNLLAGHMDIIKEKPDSDQIVLTPHPGEFFRLAEKRVSNDIHERLKTAADFAAEYGVVLVLKGSPSVIAEPGGRTWVNPSGNDGMASGGTGDVLTGVIASLLAQGLNPIGAAVAGCFLHGLAGDFAADEMTARALIAGDMIEFLPAAFDAVGV